MRSDWPGYRVLLLNIDHLPTSPHELYFFLRTFPKVDKKEEFAEDDLPNFTLEFEFLKEEEEVLAEVLPELVAKQPKKKSRFVDSTEEERNKLSNDSQTKATKYKTKWVVSLFSGKQSHHLLIVKHTHKQIWLLQIRFT